MEFFHKYVPKIRALIMLMVLLLAIALAYGKVGTFDYIDFDDGIYVRDNPHVAAGLEKDSGKWAFSLESSRGTGTYYHPLAWMSHMADVQLFGIEPGRHHLMNLAWHMANAALLFLLLCKMTNAYWRSLFVAAMFGLHPVNVETVAWVAERKNLLSTFFWQLTMLSYWFYARKPGMSRYALTLIAFVCGLLSKPMVVTLPFVLLLMDYWPLNRFQTHDGDRQGARYPWGRREWLLVLEKAPFLFLALMSICISLISLESQSQIAMEEAVPMDLRFAHAVVTYVLYLIKLVMPVNLAIFHPYPAAVPLWQVAGAGLLMAGAGAWAISMRRKHPFLIVGLLWYAVTLVPVLGIIQGGRWPAYAERWAYVPFIGMFIIIAWGIPLLLEKLGRSRDVSAAIPVVILIFWGGLTWIQTGYWKDSLILFSHAVDVTRDNYLIENNLGNAYKDIGILNLAEDHYKEALRINPKSAEVHSNLGNVYAKQNDYEGAMRHISIARQLKPDNAYVYLNMGNIMARFGHLDKAAESYRHALKLNPRMAQACYNLGLVSFQARRMDEAMAYFHKALLIRPAYAEAHIGLADVFISLGRHEEARKSCEDALKMQPDLPAAMVRLKMLAGIKKNRAQG